MIAFFDRAGRTGPLAKFQTLWLRLGPVRFLVVALQHSAGNFRGRRPNAARCTGVALVFVERCNVGLYGFATVQKNNADRIAGNAVDEKLGVLDHAADTPV